MKAHLHHIAKFLFHGNWLTAAFLALTVGVSVYLAGGGIHHARTDKLIAELGARGVHPTVTYNPANAPSYGHKAYDSNGGGVGDIIGNAVGGVEATATYSAEREQAAHKARLEWFGAVSNAVQGNTPLILGIITAVFGYLKIRADNRRETLWKAANAHSPSSDPPKTAT